MWRSRRNRDGSKGYETCETCALCSAGRFHVIVDDLLLSEVQIIEKNREQTKNTMGLYWEVYIRKTKGIIKISVKKKKKKRKKNTEASVLRKIESSHLKSRYTGIFFFFCHFCPTKNKALTFIQTKVYIFSIRKKMTKSVL